MEGNCRIFSFVSYEMERFANKVAVVTGAASGIGYSVAKLLIKSKLIVVGLDKEESKLEVRNFLTI